MNRLACYGFAAALVSCFGLAGCNKGGSSESEAAASGTPAAQAQAAPPTDPAARVAYDFLTAVLKGDDQRVSACLTPKAIERLIESHKRFALPGVDSTTFRIGEVRKPSETQALVQCVLTDTSKPNQVQSDEMCCLVRLIDADWRVSGIAFNAAPDHPPTIIDFESAPSEPMGLPVTPEVSSTQAAPVMPQRPSPGRTADETPVPSYR